MITMAELFSEVTEEDIRQALLEYDAKDVKVSQSNSSFIVHNEKEYLAKEILRIAYGLAYKARLHKDPKYPFPLKNHQHGHYNFHGGKPTLDVLQSKGFSVAHRIKTPK